MVLKELAMHRIAYNLIRALMQRAAITYDVDLERISFKGSLDSLHHYADAIYATHRKPRKQAQSSMLCFARSPPIWSRCAPNAANLALENVAQKTINYLPNLVKKCAPPPSGTGQRSKVLLRGQVKGPSSFVRPENPLRWILSNCARWVATGTSRSKSFRLARRRRLFLVGSSLR